MEEKAAHGRSLCNFDVLNSYKEAVSSPQLNEWKKAMQKKMYSLAGHEAWWLEQLPSDRRTIYKMNLQIQAWYCRKPRGYRLRQNVCASDATWNTSSDNGSSSSTRSADITTWCIHCFYKVICSKKFIWTNQKILLCIVVNQKSAHYRKVFTVCSKLHGHGMKNLIHFWSRLASSAVMQTHVVMCVLLQRPRRKAHPCCLCRRWIIFWNPSGETGSK